MINIKFTGTEELIRGLNNVKQSITFGSSEMLDMAARDTQVKMREESPEATGFLKQSIDVVATDSKTRVIGPDANYGKYQETRNYISQRTPPLSKIQDWAAVKGFDNKAAFLIARKIKESGYPKNPFVLRTYEWVQSQLNKYIEPFISGIVASYQVG